MLAQNFKSATDLGISEKEHDALIGVMRMLERNELHHVPLEAYDEEHRFGFNMSDYSNACQTVCCIAGWCDRLYRTEFVVSDLPDELDDVFHMNSQNWGQMDNVTTGQAAAAIRSYLTTGDPCWAEILA